MGDKQADKFFSYYYRWGEDTLVSSLKKHGFRPEDVTDVLIGLGDMPMISSSLLNSLINHHTSRHAGRRAITFPTVDGGRGNPVLWDKTFFSDLSNLTGDSGGRQLIDDYKNFHNPVPSDRYEYFCDVDTIDELILVANKFGE